MGLRTVMNVGILFVIFMALYLVGIIPAYWSIMFAVIFIVVGFVLGFLILGSGEENMWVGIPLFVFGILMIVIIYFFPK